MVPVPSQVDTVNVADVLAKTAELIRVFGWRQSTDRNDGGVLLRNALAVGLWGRPRRPADAAEWQAWHRVRTACQTAVGWKGSLTDWADVPGRTQLDVLAMLRCAAEVEAGDPGE